MSGSYQSPRHRVGHITAEGAKIISTLETCQQKVFDSQQRLRAEHPSWEEQFDARFTAFSKLNNGLNSVKLSIIFIETCLLNDSWWRTNFSSITTHDRQNNTLNFVKSAKHNFGIALFILIENTFRLFLRAIDPIACAGSTEAFESIYSYLLRSKLSVSWPNTFDLLKLVRLMRNTIHNDGVYLNRNAINDVVIYKGVEYSFYHGKPVTHVTWDYLLTLAEDIHNLLVQLVSNEVIAEHANGISDPTATL